MASASDQRVFGHHEAAAMFEAIGSTLLAALGHAGAAAQFLGELRAERELLVDSRTRVHLALLRDRDKDPERAVANALRVLDGKA